MGAATITESKAEKAEALEDKLGSAFDRIKKTVQVRVMPHVMALAAVE